MFVHILYLNIQVTQQFFWPSFLFSSTHERFQDKGCVWDGVPEVLGRAMAGARISVYIINNQMYILKITVVYYNHQVSIYDLT